MADVTITQDEYDRLLEDSAFLNALEQAGVDNWQGHEEAMRIFEEMNDMGDETQH